MTALSFTLLGEGSSDAMLVPVVRWLLEANGVRRPVLPAWADLSLLHKKPKGLAAEIQASLENYPCDLLFVHRDADNESREDRLSEIQRAFRRVNRHPQQTPPHVCVIPVRETETWFLFDEPAIRAAVGNPLGSSELHLPPVPRLEDLSQAKEFLEKVLWTAKGHKPHRRHRFSPGEAKHRLAELISDFSPLRRLPAFAALEQDIQIVIKESGWDN
jgi:hypothetical protein